MVKLLVRWAITAFAIWVASEYVDGVILDGNWQTLLWVALVFGIVNTIVKPILQIFSFPFILITLGLFLFVINAAVLGLTAWLTDALIVTGFVPALLGSLVISIINWIASRIIDNDKEDEARMREYRQRFR